MSRELGHDCFGAIICSLSHILVAIAEAEEEVGKDVYNIGFKESAKHGTQLGESKKTSLSVSIVLLVLQRLGQLGHDVQLFEGEDSKPLDKASKAIGSTFPLAKVFSVEQGVQ